MDFGVDVVKPAVVAIDCHRGHFDPAVATMPLADEVAERLIAANGRFFDRCRDRGVPVIHLVTSYRDVAEIRANPFWRTRADDADASRKNVERHNIEGSVGCEIIPSLYDADRDWVVATKKRYDCFVGTDLDFLLKTHDLNTLLITGVNTSSCVLATVTAANVRDYVPIVVEDCVDTMDGPVLHEAALTCIRAAFGWVMTSDRIVQSLFEDALFTTQR